MKLEVEGLRCKLQNKYLTIAFSESAKAESLIFNGTELLEYLDGAENDPDKKNSFYCDYHTEQGVCNMKPDTLKVIDDGEYVIHVAYMDTTSPLKLEYHIILEADDTAVYGYVVAENDNDNIMLDELRTVYRLDSKLFQVSYTNERQGIQPRAQYLAQNKRLQDETFWLEDGSKYSNSHVYSKYDYAGYFSANSFWGQYGEQYGAWFIPIDKSGYPSGPLKQELMVHYDGIILNYMTSEHFGSGKFEVPKKWKKMYGPWCMYFNSGKNKIEDADNRAEREIQKLPHRWIGVESEIYSRQLCCVSGTLTLKEAIKEPIDGWTIVLTDQQGDYYKQKSGRIYYSNTKSEGKFKIEKIQPGTYWMYVYVRGSSISDEFELGKFMISGNQDLGIICVENNMQSVIWKIGGYSKTTCPFRFSDQLRNYIWKELVPSRFRYCVGQEEEWYYLQNSNGSWEIEFLRPLEYAKKYCLTICLAGATQKSMGENTGVGFYIYLNNMLISRNQFENDKSAYRSSVTNGISHKVMIHIKEEQLKDLNVIRLETDGYIMYDMLKLEAEGGREDE